MSESKICPVCGTEKHWVERCVIAEGERKRAYDAERLARWRDDRSPYQQEREFATVSTVVNCAADTTDIVIGPYTLMLSHVLHFHGKGYMPFCIRTEEGRRDGNFYVCETYDAALEEGRRHLQERVEREEAEYQAFCKEQDELRRKQGQ